MIIKVFKSIGAFFIFILIIFYAMDYLGIDPFPKDKNADHDHNFILQANKFDSEYLKTSTDMFKATADESLVATPELKSKISEGLFIYKDTLKNIKTLDPPLNKTLKIFYDEYIRQREREIAAFERLIVAIDSDNVNLYNNSIDDIKDATNKVEVQEHSLFD